MFTEILANIGKWVIANSVLDKATKIFRWVGFGVLAAYLPLLCIYFYCWIVGYSIDNIKYLSDFLLVTFAVSAAALSYVLDGDKSVHKFIRGILGAITIVSMVYCLIAYVAIFDSATDRYSFFFYRQDVDDFEFRINILECWTHRLFWGNASIGALIEILSWISKKKGKFMCTGKAYDREREQGYE
jgi:hypothetical protein